MFNLTSVIKAPESSVMVGLAEAALVYVIYQHAVPVHVDIRSADAHNVDVEASRRAAAWKGASIIGLVLLMTKDINSAVIAGAALAGMDLMIKHANGVNPSTGKLDKGHSAVVDNDVAWPMTDYADTELTMSSAY